MSSRDTGSKNNISIVITAGIPSKKSIKIFNSYAKETLAVSKRLDYKNTSKKIPFGEMP